MGDDAPESDFRDPHRTVAAAGDDAPKPYYRDLHKTIAAALAALSLALIVTLIVSDRLATWPGFGALCLAAFGLPFACTVFVEYSYASAAQMAAVQKRIPPGWGLIVSISWFAPVGALILALWNASAVAAIAFVVACVAVFVQGWVERPAARPRKAPPRDEG